MIVFEMKWIIMIWNYRKITSIICMQNCGKSLNIFIKYFILNREYTKYIKCIYDWPCDVFYIYALVFSVMGLWKEIKCGRLVFASQNKSVLLLAKPKPILLDHNSYLLLW